MLLDLNQSILLLRAQLSSYRIFRDAKLAKSFDDVFKRTVEQFKLERESLYNQILNESAPVKSSSRTRERKTKQKQKLSGNQND